MSSSDPLVGIRSKIERANKHVTDLDATLRDFYDSNPYRLETKRDTRTGKQEHYLTRVAEALL